MLPIKRVGKQVKGTLYTTREVKVDYGDRSLLLLICPFKLHFQDFYTSCDFVNPSSKYFYISVEMVLLVWGDSIMHRCEESSIRIQRIQIHFNGYL